MKHKERLDVLLVSLGLAESRAKAQATIMAGEVYVNGQKADKSGMEVDITSNVEVRGSACPYVSRGGLKLEKALRNFGVDPTGYVCSDSGASTGGFTDCLLQQGASKVFAIDVGYGQLAWKIRNDPRVVVMERTNIRYVTPEDLGQPLDLSVIDVSFISLSLVLPVVKTLLKPTGQVLCLIKPQFEAGKDKVGKKGVVRDAAVHEEVLQNFITLAKSLDFTIHNLTFSPVKVKKQILFSKGAMSFTSPTVTLPLARLERIPPILYTAKTGCSWKFLPPHTRMSVSKLLSSLSGRWRVMSWERVPTTGPMMLSTLFL